MLSDQRHNKEKIQQMFAAISKRYDLLNRVLSFNQDKYWRRVAVSKLRVDDGSCWLDMCAGTGDVSIEIVKQENFSGSVVAGDFCAEMLRYGIQKCNRLNINNIKFVNADAENLPFGKNMFDGAIIAFGIRNIADRKKALLELIRTVRNNRRIVILEFSSPTNRIFKSVYHCYFKRILPFSGSILSKNDTAYSYLPASVQAFPGREEFSALMKNAGMKNVEYFDLTFGIVTIYVGTTQK